MADSFITSPSWPVTVRWPLPGIADASMNRMSPPTGLAWTPVGGDILFIEASAMPGSGHLTVTGQLGDVMKESAMAAMSYVRVHSRELGLEDDYFQNRDIHIHVPAGAIPKDGPSAGRHVDVDVAVLEVVV